MSNQALNTLARIKAARDSRITADNPEGHQSEALRVSSQALRAAEQRGQVADQTLADAMARLRN